MSASPQPSSRLSKLLTFPLLFALCAALFSGNAERLHARLLWLGESLFTGYFQLQSDPKVPPNCDDLFKDNKEQSGASAQEEEDLEGLFGDDESATEATSKNGNDQEEEDLEGLFGEEESTGDSKNALLEAQRRAKEQCEKDHIAFAEITARITPGVKVFRLIEGGVSAFIRWVVEHFKHILAIIFLLGALVASVRDEHIALRPAQSVGVYRIRAFAQLVAFAFVALSTWYYRSLLTLPEERTLNLIWLIGLGTLTLWHAYAMTLSPHFEEEFVSDPGASFLSIPLFAVMGWISGIYFFSVGHPTGLAIELTKLTEHAILYVNVALYVWVGMLLKQSVITTRVFDLLRPLKLEPSILAAVVVVGAAIPTAYSGASGIFVIAAGALIYNELRKAGARRHLALAATAMSGSLGVVLSPCLLVVIIASLNKQVTTDELYSWGVWVFILTALLFVIISFIQRDRSMPMIGRSFGEASGEVKRAALRLVNPILIALCVILTYWFVLDTVIDEHSAPMVLPVLLICLLWRESRAHELESDKGEMANHITLSDRLGLATAEAGPHIGALLVLMGLSICVGGVIERGEVMAAFPESFGSVWLAMSALVFILVIIGMSMDPYGAVILVSATIAEVAYQSGINPVHFWMVVLVAFELGYLSPPVALNHLLTRQVVGEREFYAAKQEVSGLGFWGRYERILLPLMVMGIALIIVAFGPLFFY